MAQPAKSVKLQPPTVEAFDAYIRQAEVQMEHALDGAGPFLWCDLSPEIAQQVHQGQVVAESWSEQGPVPVPDGLIHDWIGAIFVPATNLKATLELVQDYDHHKNIYKPDVIDSRLVSRDGNSFQIYLRLLKKKIVTVVLDTDHDVRYQPLDQVRWICRSYSHRIAEVEYPGSARELVLPPDSGHGFLWRLYSYWRFEERQCGVYIECRAISLSRDVPFGLGWVVDPIIRKLPKESLIHTLSATRQGLVPRAS